MSSKRRPRATPDVDVDAQAINLEHDKGEQAQRTSLEHFRRCGELLARKKASLSHGEWGPWLRANIKFAERTAQRYMTFADLVAKSATVADLPDRWPALWDRAKRGKRAGGDDDPDPDPDDDRRRGRDEAEGYILRTTVIVTFDPDIVTPATDRRKVEKFLRAGQVHWVLKNGRGKTLGRAEMKAVESLDRIPSEGGHP